MKNVLVTGGLRGIGRSVVEVLSQEGYAVTAVYNGSEDHRHQLIQNFPKVEVEKADLSSRTQVESLVQKLTQKRWYAVVNVAGVALTDTVDDFDIKLWDQTMAINLTAPLLISLKLADNLEENGSIVNVTSIYGTTYGMNMSLSYGASKAALMNLTKSLCYQLRNKQLRVNAVAPSVVDTDMTAQDPPEKLAEVSRRSAAGRIARPAEIANIVSFLISDKASYINGQTLIADGGYTAWDGVY